MRFDAYCSTIHKPDLSMVKFAHMLADTSGGIVCKGPQVKRYGDTLSIELGPRMAAWVGYNREQEYLFMEAKGETSPLFASTVREHFPIHSVPRADVCEDIDEEGAFDAIQATVREHMGPRVKGGYVALPDNPADGKTWSAGVRGGVAYFRLYEKGKQPEHIADNRPFWVRPELEVRPHYARDKLAAATMEPQEMWGFAAWSQRVGEALTGLSINRFEPQVRQYSFDKTTRYIALTFRRHFEEMMNDGLHIGRTLQAVWEEEDRLHRGMGQ